MATFITTIKFTEKGVQAIQDSPKRANAFKSAAKKLGAKVKEIYWTLGDNDGLIIFEAPDDESATAVMLQASAQGFVHTSTSRAFAVTEMESIVGRLSGRK